MRGTSRRRAQAMIASMMSQAAIDCPSLRVERIRLIADVHQELRLDLAGRGNPAAFAEDLGDAITASRSARWRRKTAARAARIGEVARLLLGDLAKRQPRRERTGPGEWSITAIDDAGGRVLVAEMTCAIPRSFADPCPVVVVVKTPELLLDGEVMKRAIAGAQAEVEE
jgi:hypothetical protein